jgi:hypothetical protein
MNMDTRAYIKDSMAAMVASILAGQLNELHEQPVASGEQGVGGNQLGMGALVVHTR